MLFSVLIPTLFWCTSNDVTGTIDETDTGIVAVIYNPDLTPAQGVSVKIFRVDDTTRTPVSERFTDSNGAYSLGVIAKGKYNIYAENDTSVAFQDSITVLDDTVLIHNDTLETPVELTGVIGLQPNHDPRTTTVQVVGTNLYSNVNEKGYFTLHRMAKGEFTLKLATTLPNYTTTFENITISPLTADTLTDTLWLIYTGIPVVEGIEVTYDTSAGIVQLHWNEIVYTGFQDYLIFRDPADSIRLSESPIAATIEALYSDTIFRKMSSPSLYSLKDTNDYRFKYRVIVRNNSQVEGQSFKLSMVTAVAPLKVQTKITSKAFHNGIKEYSDTVSINDTLTIFAKIENRNRNIVKVTWTDLKKDSVVRKIDPDSVRNMYDTLQYSWATTGRKNLLVTVNDEAGYAAYDTVSIFVARDMPESVVDTEIYVNVPFIVKGKDRFGSITSFIVDSNYNMTCQLLGDTAALITIHDTLTDNYKLTVTMMDDDDNTVIDTIRLTLGIKWEKCATSFLGTDTVCQAVVLNNALFVFTKSHQIYKSADGINWSLVVESTPWKKQFTKPIVHNNKVYLIEAVDDSTDTNSIWFSDNGTDWSSQQIKNFQTWYPHVRTSSNSTQPYLDEMFLISLKNKLWAGSGTGIIDRYYGTDDREFVNSNDGINWSSSDTECTPTELIKNQQSSHKVPYNVQYTLNDSIMWYAASYYDWSYIYMTRDFKTHSNSYFNLQWQPLPTIAYYYNTIIICWGAEVPNRQESTGYLQGSEIVKVKTYPGSFYNVTIVFKGKLYSISNNGVYVVKS